MYGINVNYTNNIFVFINSIITQNKIIAYALFVIYFKFYFGNICAT